MWVLSKSYYVSAGFDTRMLFKAISYVIDPETKRKLCLTAERAPRELIENFHPCQLEKRFGGEADTPKNFWPPRIGEKFIPNDDDSYLDLMTEAEYIQSL
jgi:hypothetical protein